ncbi:MAG: M20/M25/M40 family metallo-hydrolase, partial [Rhodobiaceae bacterium]|nr:M20/M25/M40 family metallo-hydrolase [Rhodobiaceae bacterium]
MSKLVSFDTTSCNSNIGIIEFITSYFENFKISPIAVRNIEANKVALYATIGPNVEGGVVFSAHTDTVPANPKEWKFNPLRLTEVNRRYYGLGSVDMKGFISIILSLIPYFQYMATVRPIHIALSYDEEVGCLGVRPLLKSMQQEVAKPSLVIVGEPTEQIIVNSHKSCYTFNTIFKGKEAHSSNPDWGLNSITYAAKFIDKIDEVSRDILLEEKINKNFNPPNTTLNIGKIIGGKAHNIVPSNCEIIWSLRVLPGTNADEIIQKIENLKLEILERCMQPLYKDADIQTEMISSILALDTKIDSPALDFMKKILNDDRIES